MTLAIQDHFADPILDNLPIREIDIDNRGNSSELTDYQVDVDVSNHIDQQGVRFVDENLQIIDYWEEDTDTIWAEIPKIIGSKVSAIRMMHGDIYNTSDGEATFEFFDDFEDGDISDWSVVTGGSNTYNANNYYLYDTGDTGCAVISHEINSISNFAFAFRFYPETPTASDTRPGVSADANPHPDYGYHVWIADSGILRLYSPSQTTIVDGLWSQLAKWYDMQFIKYGTSFELFIDGASQGTGSNSEEDIMHYIRLEGSSVTGRPARYDNVRVRKYTSPEPTAVIA